MGSFTIPDSVAPTDTRIDIAFNIEFCRCSRKGTCPFCRSGREIEFHPRKRWINFRCSTVRDQDLRSKCCPRLHAIRIMCWKRGAHIRILIFLWLSMVVSPLEPNETWKRNNLRLATHENGYADGAIVVSDCVSKWCVAEVEFRVMQKICHREAFCRLRFAMQS